MKNMLWIFTNGSHKIIYSAEQVTHFFESGGFYYGRFFVQKIGLDRWAAPTADGCLVYQKSVLP